MGAGGGRAGGEETHHRFLFPLFFLLLFMYICYECHSSRDPTLIGHWRLTAGTRCQDLESTRLSDRLCES